MSEVGVDPETLIGDRVLGVSVGWLVRNGDRRPVQYFLRFESGILRVRTEGSGSIGLVADAVPADFDMDQYGRVEFCDVDAESPFARLIGRVIVGIDSIRWRDTEIGLRLLTDTAHVVLANEGDEVFVSDGDLPPDYENATID